MTTAYLCTVSIVGLIIPRTPRGTSVAFRLQTTIASSLDPRRNLVGAAPTEEQESAQECKTGSHFMFPYLLLIGFLARPLSNNSGFGVVLGQLNPDESHANLSKLLLFALLYLNLCEPGLRIRRMSGRGS